MKSRLKGAQTGHSLLKRKAEALTKRFRTITHRIDEVCIMTRYTPWAFLIILCSPIGPRVLL